MYYAGMWGKKVHSSIQMPVKENPGSPQKNSKCCSKIQFLEAILFVSTLSHILVLSIGCSIMFYPNRRYVEFGGYEFYSSQTGPDLVSVGVVGTIFSLMAIVGLWKRSRGLMIPMIFYLAVFLLVDFVSFLAYFFQNNWQSDDIFENLENLEVIRVGNDGVNMLPSDQPDLSALMICLFIKIIGNIIFLKLLINVYRKNLMMRTSRSPLRNTNQSTAVEVDNATPVKPGKYVQIV
jgi:hypothetical protein